MAFFILVIVNPNSTLVPFVFAFIVAFVVAFAFIFNDFVVFVSVSIVFISVFVVSSPDSEADVKESTKEEITEQKGVETTTLEASGVVDGSNRQVTDSDGKAWCKLEIVPIIGTPIVESLERDASPPNLLMA